MNWTRGLLVQIGLGGVNRSVCSVLHPVANTVLSGTREPAVLTLHMLQQMNDHYHWRHQAAGRSNYMLSEEVPAS